MRTSDPNERLLPGMYYITPESKPEISPEDKKPFFEVCGFRAWGGPKARVRKRRDNWTAADKLLREYEEGDADWSKTHEQKNNPVVIVSKKLDEARLAEAERAVALLPLDEHQRPDNRYRLDDAVTFALKCGWNPKAGHATIKEICEELRAWLKWRKELPWKNEDHLANPSYTRDIYNLKQTERMFGHITVANINSKEYQKKVLDGLKEPDNYKQFALLGLSRLLNFLLDRERISVVRIYSFGLKSEGVPQVMNLLSRQEYLDTFWDTDLAAAAVARFHMGLRPLSDLKKSKAAAPWGLTPDLRYYLVPKDAKTGNRAVEVPPVARMLFEILKKQHRLGTVNEHGNYELHIGLPETWSRWYLKMGYNDVTPSQAKKNSSRLRNLPDSEAVADFIKLYPRKHSRRKLPSSDKDSVAKVEMFIEDAPRHGSISAYVHTSGGMVESAGTYHGNTRKIILAHYLALMSRAEAFLQYRMIPTCLLAEIDPSTIPLPPWAKPELMTDEDKCELVNLRASLPKHTPDFLSIPLRAQAARRAAIARHWEAKMTSPEWKKELEKAKTQLAHARAVKSERDKELRGSLAA